MKEIEFSVMEDQPGSSDNLLPLLHDFEEQKHIHVNLLRIPWPEGWAEVTKFGVYGYGPDISEIGATWIGSLAAMDALQPFTSEEIRILGGAETFFKSIWRTVMLPNDKTPWAVPYLGDVLVLIFWRDALEKAGISEPRAAFADHTALVKTLESLQNAGYEYPLDLTTVNDGANLHEVGCWVWGAGGDFVSPDYRQVTFHEGRAFEGLENYFSLLRFISPETRNGPTSRHELFREGQAAVNLTGPWLGNIDRKNTRLFSRLGIASVPGVPYVGGSCFVIWKYTPRKQEAFELIRFLTSQQAYFPASPLHMDMLPARREAINNLPADDQEFQRLLLQSLQTGRSFPTMRLWGSIEDRLNKEIANIWGELFAGRDQDIAACMHRHLDPLAQRLNLVLGG
jgi:ABC-type glycerol-3-phosphate transport system substrate-binding protein